MVYEVFSLAWDDLGQEKVLQVATSRNEANQLVDSWSERLPHAYIDHRVVVMDS